MKKYRVKIHNLRSELFDERKVVWAQNAEDARMKASEGYDTYSRYWVGDAIEIPSEDTHVTHHH